MRNLAGVVMLMQFACLADAQTIHKKDFPMFLGRAASVDTIINGDTIKTLKFDMWKIDSLDSNGRRKSFHDSSLVGGTWFSPDADDYVDPWENEMREYRFPDFRFCIMADIYGYGGSLSFISIWQRITLDSLKYICGVTGPFGGNLLSSDIKWIGRFPDSSILVYIVTSGGDECDWWGGNTFLRGADICSFRPFYDNFWSGKHGRVDQYYTNFIGDPGYQVMETNIYFSEDTLNPSSVCPNFKLDSAVSRVLNLWQMAREYFKIDSSGE